jgi:hypothetical protein
MPWPDARLTSYTPSAAVKSNDLNAIQDAIIGMKHPVQPLHLGAGAFFLKNGGGLATLGVGQWTCTGAADLLCEISPLVPQGHRLVSITWRYNRGGAGTVTRRARQREMSVPGAVGDLAGPGYPIADVTGAAIENNLDTLNYTMPATTSVWLEIQISNAAHIFYGVSLAFDRL